MNSIRIAALAAATLGCAFPGLSGSITIGAMKDNTLYEDGLGTGTLSNGIGAGFFAGKNGSNLIRRGLVAFNVAGAVPAGATITAVSLTLNMSQSSAGLTTVSLFRVLADWGEGTSNATVGGGGQGAASTTNDATWIHRFFNTSFWTSAGGDAAAVASASLGVNGVGFYTWTSTAALVSDVQTWLDTPAANFGWMLRGDESVATTLKRFDSRENTTAANRPALTITFTPPTSVEQWELY